MRALGDRAIQQAEQRRLDFLEHNVVSYHSSTGEYRDLLVPIWSHSILSCARTASVTHRGVADDAVDALDTRSGTRFNKR
jgi:hypothetical protein